MMVLFLLGASQRPVCFQIQISQYKPHIVHVSLTFIISVYLRNVWVSVGVTVKAYVRDTGTLWSTG